MSPGILWGFLMGKCAGMMMLRQGCLRLSAIIGMLGGLSCGDGPTPPPPPGTVDLTHNDIAFITDGNVASMREDGSNRVMLTRDTFNLEYEGIFGLLWSPDGTRLAAKLVPGPSAENLITVAADGSGYRVAASGYGNWGIGFGSWSPDGSRITYWKANQAHLDQTRIYTIEVDGGAEFKVVTDTGQFLPSVYHDLGPAWSPDGSHIAFLSDRRTAVSPDYAWRLFLVDAGGSIAKQLSLLEVNSFSWAPDGRRIAIVEGFGSYYGNILRLDLDDGSTTRLSTVANVDVSPVWSRDGNRVAFVSIRDGNQELYVMNTDGTGVRRLTADPAADVAPTWSPGGLRLAFQTNRDGNWEIYTIGVDGTGLTNLTRSPGNETAPAWR